MLASAEAAESKATVAIAQAANAKLALEATKYRTATRLGYSLASTLIVMIPFCRAGCALYRRRCARTTAAHEHWERTELQPQADAWVAAAQQRHDASIAGGGGSGVGARTGLQALRDKHGELKRAEAVAQSKLDEVRGRVQAEVDRREAQAEVHAAAAATTARCPHPHITNAVTQSVQAEQGIAAAKRRQAELRRLVAVAKQRESNLETLLQERETAATNLSRRCSELEGRIQHHVDRALHAVPSRSNSSSNSVSRGMAGRASGGAAAGASAAVTVTAQSQAARKGYSFTPTTPSASFDMPTPSRRQRRASPWSSNGGYH